METKESIISATFNLLLRKGYDGVSISDIQNETGMARGLLYHYFGNKETLFVEATTHYFLDMFDMNLEVVKNYDVELMIAYVVNKYRLIIDQTFGAEKRDERISIVDYDFLFYKVMQTSNSFASKYRQAREHETMGWQIALHNSSIKGSLKEEIVPGRVANYFVYLTDGVWMNAVHERSSEILITDLRDTLTDYYRIISR